MLTNIYGMTVVGRDWIVKVQSPIGYVLVYYILGGNTVYRTDSQSVRLKKNYLYVFPTNLHYQIVSDVADPLNCIFIHLDIFPDTLTELAEIDVENIPMVKHIFEAIKIAIQQKHKSVLKMLAGAFEEYLYESGILSRMHTSVTDTLLYIAEKKNGGI